MPITLTKEFTQKYEIKYLPKEKYSNFVLQMDYTTDYFYDVVPEVQNKDCWTVSFIRKKLETPIFQTICIKNIIKTLTLGAFLIKQKKAIQKLKNQLQ